MSGADFLGGKVVVVTGGARGIGLATATALHRLDAKVAIGDIDEAAVKDSGTDGGLDHYGRLDVTDRESFAGFLDDVEETLGPIDVLVNNAGICPAGRAADEPDSVTERILAVNVYGVIVGTKLALQRMLKRGSGHIINVASVAAEVPVPGIATYSATKHAVLGYTDSVRAEYRGRGVHFSTVLPMLTNTELTAGTRPPKGLKYAEPSDVSKAIVGLIIKPRPRVTVTRLAGVIFGAQQFMPGRLAEALRRGLGSDHVFVDAVDTEERRPYEARARRS